MQIFGVDLMNRHAICSGKGAISVFFAIDDSSSNKFFDWQDDALAGEDVIHIDLS